MTEAKLAAELVRGTTTETGWSPPIEGMSWEEWDGEGRRLRKRRRTHEELVDTDLWQIGDWFNYGEDAFSQEASQAVDEADYTDGAYGVIARTCEAFPHDKRHPPKKLSLWKHAEFRTIGDASARWELARKAAEGGWTKQRCRDEAADWKRAHQPEGLFEDEPADARDLPSCPLCSGSGVVTEDRREAYFREEVSRV